MQELFTPTPLPAGTLIMEQDEIKPSIEDETMTWASAQPFTIVVGLEKIPFSAIVSHVRKHSPNFGQNVAGGLSGQTVVLPDVQPQVIETVLYWIYTKQLKLPAANLPAIKEIKRDSVAPSVNGYDSKAVSPETMGSSNHPANEDNNASSNGAKTLSPEVKPASAAQKLVYFDLLELYIFGHTYDFRVLRNDVVKKWQQIDRLEDIAPHHSIINRAYEHIGQGDAPLLRFLANIYAARWAKAGKRPAQKSQLPAQFTETVLDLTLAIAADARDSQKKSFSYAYRRDPCKFHEHDGEMEQAECEAEHQEAIELEKLRKRKLDYEIGMPRLRKRIADHKEHLEQANMDTRTKLNNKKIKWDKDGLFTSTDG
ncbi:hypothetical protein EJ08DRAFT_40724 [Tothia fuscella]|uniref:BTB domain-containing protein n=1 Tax=Tothia fuscella TaxID=1048955 RepID=A0A9P4NY62_9PEZI|nr:hypothetical protein EJ08DRAFT_40724 [Tothia fuscella]